MVRIACIGAAIVLTASAASAQATPAPPPTTITIAVQRAYATLKTNLTQAAEKMPEADYGFKPSSMPEMRVYGALFSHIAQSQFGTCAAVNGVPNPVMGRQLEVELTTKADIVKALADSFVLCDAAYASLSDANVSQLVAQGRGQIALAAILANNISHDNEMAGTAYVYLRAKGMVPPSTENAAAARGGGGGGGGRGRGAGAPPPGR
ncbi:MAG: DinB family protein [Gemmatimonadetes bacterium]|nr:DinB family protein [Gemmatimonadota bacterium]